MIIDTGETPLSFSIGYLDGVMAAVEQIAPDGSGSRHAGAIVQIVAAELRKPKRIETVRRKWIALWPIIAPLAETYPAGFDELILEYADRATSLT